jgi:hypothetical protein
VEKACLPPGLVAVLDGTIDLEGSSAGEGTSGSGGERDDLDEEDVKPPPDDALGLGTQGGSEGSSGCALRDGSSGAAWLWLLPSVLLVVRRRRVAG